MHEVAKRIRARLPDLLAGIPLHLTHHPGSTPLGQHLRKLVKYPEQIDEAIQMDDLSRQALYMVDTISFIRSILEPALEQKEIVFADRSSFISALVYGSVDGLAAEDINRLFNLIVPPKADRVYILSCPWHVGKARIQGRNNLDHYDKKPDEFYERVQQTYDDLLVGPSERTIAVSMSVDLDNVIYVDASATFGEVVDYVVGDLCSLLKMREELTF
jgi:dTMP kinase